MSRSIRRAMIDRDHQQLSLVRQCKVDPIIKTARGLN